MVKSEELIINGCLIKKDKLIFSFTSIKYNQEFINRSVIPCEWFNPIHSIILKGHLERGIKRKEKAISFDLYTSDIHIVFDGIIDDVFTSETKLKILITSCTTIV